MNICEHLTATARVFPERTAIRFDGASFTYAELDQAAASVSVRLEESGIQNGDRVALMLANVPAFAVWYYAALRIGAIVVSISTRSTAPEVAFLTDDCEAKLFVANHETLQKVRDGLPSCVAHAVSTSDFGDVIDGESISVQNGGLSDWHDSEPNDAAVILYTSGTTGFAKGATLSHMNVRSNVHAFNHLCRTQPTDRILLAVPLFHCFGQNALLNSAFNVGATLIVQRQFDLNESKRLIADEQVTQLYGVPMMFQLLLDSCSPADLASVNYCFSAAATLPIQVSEKWQHKFGMPINEGYGLTETSPFASYNHALQFVSGSIGTPIDAVEMKIVDTDSGEECPPGALGEIAVRGPNVMLGYWNRREDTEAAIRQGWFHSGDIGRVDERGFFYIVDRVKDMITVGGLKVYPAEVERVLLDHPAVSQAAVVGIHDDVFGEQVVGFVVLDKQCDEESTVASITQYAKDHLSNYKVPRIVSPIDELPRNPSGKVLKRQLREFDPRTKTPSSVDRHSCDTVETQSTHSQGNTTSLLRELDATHKANRGRVATTFVQNLVHAITNTEQPPDATERFLEMGLDSLTMVEISNGIRHEIGTRTEVPATLVFDHPRICDLADFLVSALESEEAPDTNEPAAVSASNLRDEVQGMTEEEALSALMKELENG